MTDTPSNDRVPPAFVRVDATYAAFAQQAATLEAPRRLRLLDFVHQAAVFSDVGDLLPLREGWRHQARQARVDSDATPMPADAIGLSDVPTWEQSASRHLWWSCCLTEGAEVRRFFAPAISRHSVLKVRDPYFGTWQADTRIGRDWLLNQCVSAGYAIIDVICTLVYNGPNIGQTIELVAKSLHQAALHSMRQGQDLQPLKLNLHVYPQGTAFHDRSFIFMRALASPWESAFFIGTGISGFSTQRGRPTYVGRARPGSAADVVGPAASPIARPTMQLVTGERPFVEVNACPEAGIERRTYQQSNN